MFNKLLVANRGEIAARIVRTCKRLVSRRSPSTAKPTKRATYPLLADEAYLVGPAHVTQSYLNIERILQIALDTGCDAVHPGYGLLSENGTFVHAVREAGMTFIGPSADVMRLMGDKAAARAFATQAGVPVVPGSQGEINDEDAAVEFAESFGYPVLVKASAGGGGIGMKIARKEKALRKAMQECQRRGESAFGNAGVYLERYVEDPRHIEIQVFGDAHGNVIHLFERECSVQRRHQKVIEESPAPVMAKFPGLRDRMAQAAVDLSKAAKYENAGTIEFIVSPEGEFFFIEMNTRLQVEHPVTELVTGLDLVELQLRVAKGEALPQQSSLHQAGHAIECRIYAEDPDRMFMPQPGHITDYVEPTGEGVRVDSGVRGDWDVTPYYDPMIAKLAVHADSRDAARARMAKALDEFTIGGLTTNRAMHRRLMDDAQFAAGDFHTGWLEEWVKAT
ncbi:MAG: biotin carboxylase N-terminal domain-containing protein [bacterium]